MLTTSKIKFCLTQQKEWNCGDGNGFGGGSSDDDYDDGGGYGGGYVYRVNSMRDSDADDKGACRFV